MKKQLLLTLSLAPLAIFQTGEAWAFPNIRDAWRAKYPTSTSSDTANCQLCHLNAGGGEPWNDYGWAVRVHIENGMTPDQAFAAVEGDDSDGDPNSSANLLEILADTQPGWTPGANNGIHLADGTLIPNQSPPAELSGIVLDPVDEPNIKITPNSVEFGQVSVGSTGDSNVEITNIGLQDLTINSIDLCNNTSTEFTWQALTSNTISPGDSETLVISYTPTKNGSDSGCLEIDSNDPDESVESINVTGDGKKGGGGSGGGGNGGNGGGGNGGGGGSNGGGGPTKVNLSNELGAENGVVNGFAENGEMLTHSITLTNTGKKNATVDVTTTVPANTDHAGSDSFTCDNTTAGSSCSATGISVPGNSDTVLTFAVTVNAANAEIVNTVSASDIDCNTGNNSCTVTTPPETAPSVAISTPADNGKVSDGGFTVTGTASDDGAIAGVSVHSSNNGSEADHGAAYNSGDGTWTVDLPSFAGGDVTLTATATDNNGNNTVSGPVVVKVLPIRVRHLLNRITYGVTPDQLDDINSGAFDMNAYRDNQLALTPSVGSCDDMDPGDPTKPTTPTKYSAGYSLPISTQNDLAAYAALKAAFNPCQLQEVLTQFWDNHFHTRWSTVNAKYAVENGGVQDQPLTVSWELAENDFFRTNALGNFRDLVEFNAMSPTMLYYLDSYLSEVTAPNENYARELLELHTVEVGNHTQADVEEGARAFTGWTVDVGTGTYTCDPAKHDYGAISLDLTNGVGTYNLAARTPDGTVATCEAAGQWVIDQVIAHPNTANFICKKLTAVLVNDDPPASVVSACASAFLANTASPDQIKLAVEAILTTPRFADADDYLDKVKTPLELASGYLRTFEIPETGDLEDIQAEIQQMSMDLFQFSTPDGYPETAIDWVNSELLLQRFRFVSDVAFNTSVSGDVYIDPLAFFTGHGKTTDVDIVDFLMDLALANGNTTLERDEALAVLNNGSTYVSVDDATKRTRLRRLLAVVLSYPGYQYQ